MNVLRAVKLFSLVRGLAGNNLSRASDLMGQLHGLPQKIGQHFNLYMGAGMEQYFLALCTEGRRVEMPVGLILRELGLDCACCDLCAQASIGQVYRATCDGRALAVKVRYPGVTRKIRSDFRTLRLILLPVRLLPLRNSSLLPLLDSLEAMLLEECDYLKEAANQAAFHRLFRDDPDVLVPQVVAGTSRAMVSEWVDGRSPAGLPDGPDRWFVETCLAFFLKSLRELGMVHSDPHPGNFLLTGLNGDRASARAGRDRKLAVLDFGSVAVFTPAEAAAVRRLLLGDCPDEDGLALDLAALGVDEETLRVYRPVLGELVTILLEPLYCPGPYDFGGWRLQYRINTLLASRAWERPLFIPPKLLLLLRTLQGLYFYARKGRLAIDWHGMTKTYLG